jgi:GTPase SAR1 family protein
VQPLPTGTKLSLQEEGLQILREIPGSVAPVVVIGPYRSGKSFLLNQLLGVSCGEKLDSLGLQAY